MLSVTSEPYDSEDVVFTTRRFCKTCQQETTHEIRRVSGLVARLCLPCLERTANYELDRD
jgi:hypothetical protein